MDYFLHPSAIQKLQRRFKCKVGFYIDRNILLFEQTAKALSVSDFVIAHDSYLIPLIKGTLQGRNPNVLYVPNLAEPDEHRPLELTEEDKQLYGVGIAFIGLWSPDRDRLLPMLSESGLVIWGLSEEWKNNPRLKILVRDEQVYGLKKVKIYNAAKIVLSIEESQKQLNSVNNRIPETLACGGFVLCNWTKDLEICGLKDGESVATFKSPGEMKEKIQYYLGSHEERLRISRNGRKVVLETMTYSTAGIKLLNQIE